MSHAEFADLHLNALAAAGLVTHHVKLDADPIDQTMEMRLIAALAEATDEAIVRIGPGRLAVGAMGENAVRIAKALEEFDADTILDSIVLPEPEPEAPDVPDLTDRFDAIDAAISTLQERLPDMDAFTEKQDALVNSVAALEANSPSEDDAVSEMLTKIAETTSRAAETLEAAQSDPSAFALGETLSGLAEKLESGDDARLAGIETLLQSMADLPAKLDQLESNLTPGETNDAPNLADLVARIDALAASVEDMSADTAEGQDAPTDALAEKMDQLLDASATLAPMNEAIAGLTDAVSALDAPEQGEPQPSDGLNPDALSEALSPINDALTALTEMVSGMANPSDDSETVAQLDVAALNEALSPINATLTELTEAVSAGHEQDESDDAPAATADHIEAVVAKIDEIAQADDTSTVLTPIAEALAELTQKISALETEDHAAEPSASAEQIAALEAKLDGLSSVDDLEAGLGPIKEALSALGGSVAELNKDPTPDEPVATSAQIDALAEKITPVLVAFDPVKQSLADIGENLATLPDNMGAQISAVTDKLDGLAAPDLSANFDGIDAALSDLKTSVGDLKADNGDSDALTKIDAGLQALDVRLSTVNTLQSEFPTIVAEHIETLQGQPATQEALSALKEQLEAISSQIEGAAKSEQGPDDPRQILLLQSSLALQSMLRRLDNQVSAFEAIETPDPARLALSVDADALGQRLATEMTGQNVAILDRLDAVEQAIQPPSQKAAPEATGMILMPAGVDQVMRNLDVSVQQLEASLVKVATHPGAVDAKGQPSLGATKEFLDDLKIVFAEFLAQMQRQSGDVPAEDIA